MATIYSQRGDNLNHPTYYWNTGSTWQGGIVPSSGDTVYIYGNRTAINQSSIYTWTGTTTLTVTSTTNFPSTGSCYATTYVGRKVKIDYSGITATQLRNCVIDQSYQIFDSSALNGSYIPNGAYVHSPAPYIVIDNGMTANIGILVIYDGGYLQINSGGTINNYEYIEVRDATYIMNDSSVHNYMRNKSTNRFIINSYQMQRVLIQGDELRSNTLSTTEMNTGSTYISCTDASGFAIGDKISIYNKDYMPYVPNMYNWNYAYPSGFAVIPEPIGVSGTTYDEGFDVCGIDGNDIYIGLRNGIDAPILSATTTGGIATIYVDEQRYKTGDIVVINNSGYTITSVEDADYLLRDYNFASGATLDDWTTDTGYTTYYANFTTDGTKLRHSTTTSNYIFIKDLYVKNVKVDAWLSPYDQITGGTRDTNYYGLIISNDQSQDRYGSTSYKGTYLYVDDSNNRMTMIYRNYGTLPLSTLSSFPSSSTNPLYLNSLREEIKGLAKFTIENRNGYTKAYINDMIVNDHFNYFDSIPGTVGMLTTNSTLTCTRFMVYATCQKITINTNNTFLSGQTIYQSGSEYYHPSGCTVLKIGSVITSTESHDNLAFVHQGRTNGYYPYVRGVNSNVDTTANNTGTWALNQSEYINEYLDISSSADKYCVIDLRRSVQFSHVSFINYYDSGYWTTVMTGIQIWGSNDGTSWTEIYAKTADNRISCYSLRLRYYNCGTRNYRYIKFGSSGSNTSAANRIVNIGVHDFSSGYTITLNNTSDINIGDKIMIGRKYGWTFETTDTFYSIIAGGTKTKADYVSGLKTYYDVIGKTGNTIALERPYVHGYLNENDLVWKVNRNTRFQGFTTAALYTRGNFYSTTDASKFRSVKLINVEFDQCGTDNVNFPQSVAIGTQFKGGISLNHYDQYNPPILDGVSFHDAYIGTSGYFGAYYTQLCMRNSYISNLAYLYSYNTYGMRSYTNNIFAEVYYPNINEGMRMFNYMYNFAYNCYDFSDFQYLGNNYSNLYYQNDNSKLIRNSAGFLYTIVNFGYYDTMSPYTSKYIQIENNSAESTYSYISALSMERNPIGSMLFNNKDTGSKSYYAGGYITNYNASGNINQFAHIWKIDDLNRWGYSLSTGYGSYFIQYPNEEFVRIHSVHTNQYWPLFGMNIQVTNEATFTINFEFIYRLNIFQYAQNQYTNTGGLYLTVSKDSVIIYTENLAKVTFFKMFNFTREFQGTGNYYVLIGQGTTTGRFDVAHLSSNITTNDPDNVDVFANNFDIERLTNYRKFTRESSSSVPNINKKVRLGNSIFR